MNVYVALDRYQNQVNKNLVVDERKPVRQEDRVKRERGQRSGRVENEWVTGKHVVRLGCMEAIQIDPVLRSFW